jgi:hypothetical protein
MKRLSLLGFFGLMASILAGCPLWSDNGGPTCEGPQCQQVGCTGPQDCGANETCGDDQQCHSGDCLSWGCSAGYACEVSSVSQTAACVPTTTGTGGKGTGGSGNTGGSGTGGMSTGGTGGTGTGGMATGGTGGSGNPPVYCGKPSDCAAGQICGADGTCHAGPCSASNACIYGYTCQSDGTCASATPNACDSDKDCTNGDLCIAGSNGKGGVCTPAANQCFDQSQCGAGELCVAGKCTLGCASDTDCRDGYLCDTTHGICSTPAKACTITNDCGSATLVCVDGACVPRSTGGTCANPGDVWTENGCIPNQGATFTCTNDGTQDACAQGSICLHHSCWISCDAPNQNACNNLVDINQCKPVEDGAATYNVCGSSTNLGSQCGAGSMGLTCSGGKICIDGFCK